MKKNIDIKKIILNILIFSFYFGFSYIVLFLLKLFHIDIGNFTRTGSIIFMFVVDLIPMIFLILIYYKDLKKEFKPFKNNFFKNIDKYIMAWMIALIVMTLANVIISKFTGTDVSNNEQVVRNMTSKLPIYSIFATCLCAPFTEELAYRKAIGNIFSNKYIAIIASGILFGLAHVIGTYRKITDLLFVIPYGAFGAAFMYMYKDSKSIWTTIAIHFTHNTLLMIAFFFR